jgi:L,D-peptidoglycan transpeptidase YkuD (ErfK/YbiS/YcfS/YnhG family)
MGVAQVRATIPLGNVKQKRRLQGPLLLNVSAAPGARARGILRFRGTAIPVALGRGGIKANKFEGDGATPRGCFRLVRLWWRADRMRRPITRLPARAIRDDDGWCEDPEDRRYNRAIKLSPSAIGDRLKRDDPLYDLVIELDHNTRPRMKNRGSAVFIHIARPGVTPTAGCVALRVGELRRLLPRLDSGTRISIS